MRPALFLYNFLIIILSPIAFIAGYIITKSKGGEKGFGQRFGLIKLKGGARSKSVWFHCASVGEVKSISAITTMIRAKYPDTSIIISTMTVNGRTEAEKTIKADEAFLLPIENGSAIGYLIKLLGVKVFFIVDTEIWPNMIFTASSLSRLIMVNGKISEKTFKTYKRFRFIFRPIFRKFTVILAKGSGDFKRFTEITGSDTNVAELGNIKFQKRKTLADVELISEFKNLKYVFAASTHEPEEKIILEGYKKSGASFDKLIIAPRHIERGAEIKNLAMSEGFSAALYSEKTPEATVIIIDSFGLLEKLYAGAAKIFVGGSMANIGGHNIYEALQFEKTIATGPYMQDFEEIYLPAKKAGLTDVISSPDEASLWLTREEKHVDFKAFFAEIDEKNNRVITVIEDLINDLLAPQTHSNTAD